MLNLVDFAVADPSQITLFNHPNAKSVVTMRQGPLIYRLCFFAALFIAKTLSF